LSFPFPKPPGPGELVGEKFDVNAFSPVYQPVRRCSNQSRTPAFGQPMANEYLRDALSPGVVEDCHGRIFPVQELDFCTRRAGNPQVAFKGHLVAGAQLVLANIDGE
jgi:hypothetical protein